MSYSDPEPGPSTHFPWEDNHPKDPYDTAQQKLSHYDTPHYPAIHKAEGGPFYGPYGAIDEHKFQQTDWDALYGKDDDD
jgi:hypothetical protein